MTPKHGLPFYQERSRCQAAGSTEQPQDLPLPDLLSLFPPGSSRTEGDLQIQAAAEKAENCYQTLLSLSMQNFFDLMSKNLIWWGWWIKQARWVCWPCAPAAKPSLPPRLDWGATVSWEWSLLEESMPTAPGPCLAGWHQAWSEATPGSALRIKQHGQQWVRAQDQALVWFTRSHFSLLDNAIAPYQPMHPGLLPVEAQLVHVKILSLPGIGTQQHQALGLAVTVKLLLVLCCSRATAYFKHFSFSGNGDGIFLEGRAPCGAALLNTEGFFQSLLPRVTPEPHST